MSTPKISVVIIYNDEANLYECVHNVLFQTFSNIEVICVNNGGNERAETIVKDLEQETNKIKLLSLPLGMDLESAKRAGLSVAEGEYVIFIENNEILHSDYLKESYLALQNEIKVELSSKKLYRRIFVENDKEITELIDNRYNSEMLKYTEYTNDMRQKLLSEFEKFNRNNVENLRNNTYEILARFNALEKEFYHKDWKNKEILKTVENNILADLNTKIETLNNKIEEVKKYMDIELNNNFSKIELIYRNIEDTKQEFEKNSSKIVEDAVNSVKNIAEINDDKLKNFEKEIIFRYVNLKRIMDLQFDEIRERLNGG